jgi:hypothetical protein
LAPPGLTSALHETGTKEETDFLFVGYLKWENYYSEKSKKDRKG